MRLRWNGHVGCFRAEGSELRRAPHLFSSLYVGVSSLVAGVTIECTLVAVIKIEETFKSEALVVLFAGYR